MSTTIGASNHSAAYKTQGTLNNSTLTTTQQKLNTLFQKIDTGGIGRITKTQFEQSFNKLNFPSSVKDLGQEKVVKLLDPNSSGVITKSEFIQRMSPLLNQKVASSKTEPEEVKSTPETEVANTNEMSPLDGFALGNIINIEV